MEHPFASSEILADDLSINQLQEKITQLTQRLSFSYSTGNHALIEQLRMLLDSYNEAYRIKLEKLLPPSQNFSDKIDIS